MILTAPDWGGFLFPRLTLCDYVCYDDRERCDCCMKELVYLSLFGSKGSIEEPYAVDEPNDCPLCHYAIKPIRLSAHLFEHNGHRYIAAMYLCNHCFQSFMTFSECTGEDVRLYNLSAMDSRLLYAGPRCYEKKQFDPQINILSPEFSIIYNQALQAETSGLDRIAGIGYRKAIEFLVKDFCIHLHPEADEQIKSKLLGRCIQDYVDDARIKTLAEKAVWIGNDETHYIRKHQDRDITDMKRFIDAMVHFVSMVLITEDAASIDPA